MGEDEPYEIGKARLVRKGTDVTLISTGTLLEMCLEAADALGARVPGGSVAFGHGKAAGRGGGRRLGSQDRRGCRGGRRGLARGLGSTVAALLARTHPCPMRFVAISDQFGQTGPEAQLLSFYELDAPRIEKCAKELLEGK